MSDAKKKVQSMFASIGSPPTPSEVVGNLVVERQGPGRPRNSEPSAQLNLRVPMSVKRRVRVLATRDNISLSEVVVRAIALYEERHGSAPNL